MNDSNEERPGYKKTKVGWIPDDWNSMQLRSCIEILHGWAFKSDLFCAAGRFLVLTPGNFIESGGFRPRGSLDRFYGGDFPERYLLHKGDMLIAMTEQAPGLLGCAAIVPESGKYLHNQRLGLVRVLNGAALLAEFLFYWFNFPLTRHDVSKTAAGTKVRHTSPDRILSLHAPLPPLPVQQRIAETLTTWDNAIEQTRDLIAAKKQQKKTLMQQLLTGKKRLPGFEAEWQPNTLSSLVTRIKGTAGDPSHYPVLSITAGTGFVSQADKFSRVIAGKHIENYILLRRGEFSYNKGNSYRYPQGCVYQLHEYDEGLVPSVFYSFRVKPRKVHDAFLKHFFIAGLHNEQIYRRVNTGVRNNGLLNLNASDFFALEISLPPLEEQRAIADVLTTANHEIAALEAKLAALEQQKKGLMQKLLTGQLRVTTLTREIGAQDGRRLGGMQPVTRMLL